MIKRFKFILLIILCLTHVGIAYALGEIIMVENKTSESGIKSFYYTVNGQYHYVCTGGSQFCPSRMVTSIEPNKDNVFDLYDYEAQHHCYKINNSCRNKIINVKPNTRKMIMIIQNKHEILCKYS